MRLTGIALGEEPAALAALGLTVDEHGTAVVGGVALAATGHEQGRGLLALDLRDDGAVVEGLPVPTTAVASGAAAEQHPLGAVAVDHVVVLAGDVLATAEALGGARRTQSLGDRFQAFVVAETAVLEVVGPHEPDQRPPRLWGLALSVADVDAAAASLDGACGPVKDAVQPGRRITTVRHEELGLAVPTVLLSPRRG